MTATILAPVQRRTQAERSAETRTRLLEATLDCLDELGYAGLSTPEVARRAGLSRGAQLHHFPTKAELVAAALEHLMRRRHEDFLDAFARVPPDADHLAAAIDIIWGLMSGPTFNAWLELLIAARTDAELRPHVAAVSRRFDDLVQSTFRRLFAPPGGEDASAYDVAPRFAFALLEGLAMQRLALGEDAAIPAAVLETLKGLAKLTMPAVAR